MRLTVLRPNGCSKCGSEVTGFAKLEYREDEAERPLVLAMSRVAFIRSDRTIIVSLCDDCRQKVIMLAREAENPHVH